MTGALVTGTTCTGGAQAAKTKTKTQLTLETRFIIRFLTW
ncbi:MAG: hypothetical protein ACI9W4_002324, partial [Rhodothermales bacterium]